jgi:hypothetical protein
VTWTDDDMSAVMTRLYRQSHGVHDQAVAAVLRILAAAIDERLRHKASEAARGEEGDDA